MVFKIGDGQHTSHEKAMARESGEARGHSIVCIHRRVYYCYYL